MESLMLVAISDLHMSSGPLDDFQNDRLFVEFLEEMEKVFSEKEKEGEKINLLVLNGDILDLLEAPGDHFESKITGISSAHEAVFQRLNDLAKNYEVLYLRGNHDWDAFRPGNIDAARALFPHVKVPDDETPEETLIGHYGEGKYRIPYTDPDGKEVVIHLEHGNQYDEFNNFFYNDPRHPETSLGYLIVTEIVNFLEIFFPDLDNLDLMGLAVEVENRLKIVTEEFELDGRSPNLKERGIFTRISRAIRKIMDDSVSETAEQKLELKIHIARQLLRWLQSAGDTYLHQAGRMAEPGTNSIIIFGHTHREKAERVQENTMYINTGTWTRQIRRGESGNFISVNPRPYVTVHFDHPLERIGPEAVHYYKGLI